MLRMMLGVLGAMTLSGCGAIGGEKAADKALIEEAQNAVAGQLIDPSSPQFTDVAASSDGVSVCGYVNGKNRLGGYAGRKRFVWVKGGSAIVEMDPGEAAGSRVAKANACLFDASFQDCRGAGDAMAVVRCSQDAHPS